MLNVNVYGNGPPVLLIHAFPLSHEMWAEQVDLLAKDFTVVTPDMPGFGGSARQGKPSIPQMAQELAALLDGLKIAEPLFIGGLSMGGYITFEFLRQFPERVRGLGLFSTRAAPDTPEGRENRFKTAQKITADGLETFSKAILPKLLGATTIKSNPAVVKKVTGLILKNTKEGVADALYAMADRRDSIDLLRRIKVPTLVVAGDEDTFIPAAEAENMAGHIPVVRFRVIEQAGHLVNMEQPKAFNKILWEFLEERVLTGKR
ncbi:MAG: alpha/beta hydrolase [Candidatus Omnitrophica bacterium]|nr:alpha/beta hydrolase [Candidatus Omnitrophota bacterium]